ncbi:MULTISPECIES: hypothetical protein [unclassified Microcoleus]|uniref:hypothetical protein n=1 Tax=unclassified Microcoleus TaxID=2642155 RepID=UPI002FD161A5
MGHGPKRASAKEGIGNWAWGMGHGAWAKEGIGQRGNWSFFFPRTLNIHPLHRLHPL